MAKFSIRFKESVAKDLRGIPNQDVQRILARIDQLAEAPRGEGCIKLAGYDAYRVRQGLYRIIYTIVDAQLIIEVIKVAHRSKVYKDY
jgi:mRNA interferase RelE/StbE